MAQMNSMHCDMKGLRFSHIVVAAVFRKFHKITRTFKTFKRAPLPHTAEIILFVSAQTVERVSTYSMVNSVSPTGMQYTNCSADHSL